MHLQRCMAQVICCWCTLTTAFFSWTRTDGRCPVRQGEWPLGTWSQATSSNHAVDFIDDELLYCIGHFRTQCDICIWHRSIDSRERLALQLPSFLFSGPMAAARLSNCEHYQFSLQWLLPDLLLWRQLHLELMFDELCSSLSHSLSRIIITIFHSKISWATCLCTWRSQTFKLLSDDLHLHFVHLRFDCCSSYTMDHKSFWVVVQINMDGSHSARWWDDMMTI